ncbi:MAG TPA: hypothetical protein VLM44_03375 [Lutibacter sp.]|nr:hypothetical protein [Lutibacter sp.]
MKKTITDLKDIIRLGGGMNIDATLFTISELYDFAILAERSGAIINIKNTEDLTVNNLKDIAKLGRGKVIFKFKTIVD